MTSRNSARDAIALFPFNPLLSSLECDHYHHHYHYQASAQYTWLAETLLALGQHAEAIAAYDKAIFQDHLNEEAKARKTKAMSGEKQVAETTPRYNTHPSLDAEFCEGIGKEPTAATALHDKGVEALLKGDEKAALACFDKAIATDAAHSNSYFARGRIAFGRGDYTKAKADFEEAVKLAQEAHDAYHEAASAEHLARGQKFFADNEFDLAITDCTKALDLDRHNKEALKTRAAAYRAKNSVKLAEEDEEALRLLS